MTTRSPRRTETMVVAWKVSDIGKFSGGQDEWGSWGANPRAIPSFPRRGEPSAFGGRSRGAGSPLSRGRRELSPLRARMRCVVNLRQMLKIEMRINLRRPDVRVPEQLLHRAQIARRFEQMARARMPHQMRIDALPDALLLRTLPEPRTHAVRRQRLAAAAAHEWIGFGRRIEIA